MKLRCVHLLLCFVLLPLQLKFEAFVGIYDDEKVESRTYEQLFHSRLYDLWERSRRSSCFGARCSTTWQQSCNNLFLLKLFLLLLSGDVHLNPGPTPCYPCSMCSRLVRWNQKALQCDSCHLWVHCQCCGVSNQQYSHYQQLLTFSWCCPPCWVRDLPFHDCSVMDSTVSDDSIVSVVSSETETCYPSKLGTLRIAHLNCRSLLSHKDDVVAMFIAAQLDVLALTETWLDDTVVDSEILPCGSGLSLLRMDNADDTELHCCGEDLQCVQNDLQSDLYRVQDWLQANRLQLNVSKSVIMLIGSWQKLWNQSVSVSINGKPLASVTSTHYLGVLIDRHLTWKLHVDNVLKRIRCKLYALYRLKPLPGHLLFRLYQAFVLPVFDYCDVVWAPTTVSLSKPLERLHSRFIQQVPDCNSFVKVKLAERRRFHTAV